MEPQKFFILEGKSVLCPKISTKFESQSFGFSSLNDKNIIWIWKQTKICNSHQGTASFSTKDTYSPSQERIRSLFQKQLLLSKVFFIIAKMYNLMHYCPTVPFGNRKNILEDLFSSVLSHFKKHHPSGNLKCNNLSIFQSLKLRALVGKSFQFLYS